MRRALVILLLLLSGLRLSAQEPDSTSVVREPDNSLIGKASRLIGNASAWFQDLTPVKIFNARDTSYYSAPPGDWTIKVRSNLTGTYLSARGHSDDRNFTTRLAARHNLTHSIGVTYKGVTLGYTFSPWQRDGHDIRYDFSAYSNMAGIDATYPSYVPRGFNVSSITSENSKITLTFTDPAEDQTFLLVEEKSAWDSSALLNNFVKPTYGENYSVIREQGITIYVSGSNATWVNGGIIFKIEAVSGTLTNKQIRSIAVSL